MNSSFYPLRYLFFISSLLILSACHNQPHFLTDNDYRNTVESDCLERKSDVSNSQIFAVFRDNLNTDEREALTFLYAYMPLSDMTNNSGEFILKNVRYAFKSKNEMPWGKDVPEREFRHFVLPIRIHNEDLDSSRWIFYDELVPRVKDMSMSDAVSEVTLWCREHIMLKASDNRTLSPLALLSSAQGNSNELSVFTISALRSICIPSRYVYPSDYAGVNEYFPNIEVWYDNKWHFLNPYELYSDSSFLVRSADSAFMSVDSVPLSINTRAFGYYDGPESVIIKTPCYTEIKISENHAESDSSSISMTCDNDKKLKHRLLLCDSIRNAHTASFFTEHTAEHYCFTSSYPFFETTCSDQMISLLIKSRGNYSAILNFLYDESSHKNHHPEDICDKIDMLCSLSDKDLCEVTSDILVDHYFWADDIRVNKDLSYDIISRYIRSPRISDEKLSAYRQFFLDKVHPDAARSFRNNPHNLIYWVNHNISINSNCNLNASPISPSGVWRTQIADSHSRDIFFVAMARTFGIPSRIDSVSGKVQILDSDATFKDITFE